MRADTSREGFGQGCPQRRRTEPPSPTAPVSFHRPAGRPRDAQERAESIDPGREPFHPPPVVLCPVEPFLEVTACSGDHPGCDRQRPRRWQHQRQPPAAVSFVGCGSISRRTEVLCRVRVRALAAALRVP
jgi:hypothetical protein